MPDKSDTRPYAEHASACHDHNSLITDDDHIVECVCRPHDGTKAPDVYELWWCEWCGEESCEGSDPCQRCGESVTRRKYAALDTLPQAAVAVTGGEH